MDVERRARELLAAEIERDGFSRAAAWIQDPSKSLRYIEAEAIRAIIAALTPPDGYVLVPVEVQKDADRFRFLASWAGAEFNSERGYLRWYLSRKGRGFASLAETVDQCLPSTPPEVKP